MSQYKILLVDDSSNVLKALKRSFVSEGYEIHTAQSAEDALKVLNAVGIDLIITDENMPGVSGTELLKKIKDLYPDTVRIMLTGVTDMGVAKRAINSGEIYKFFTKPWDDFELLLSVRYALKEKSLEKENIKLKKAVEEQKEILINLEKEHPGITEKNVDSDGCIIID